MDIYTGLHHRNVDSVNDSECLKVEGVDAATSMGDSTDDTCATFEMVKTPNLCVASPFHGTTHAWGNYESHKDFDHTENESCKILAKTSDNSYAVS